MISRTIIAGALALMGLYAPAAAETWLFAAAACPPWKSIPDDPETTAKMAKACEKDIELAVNGFRSGFEIADDHLSTLVDKDATGDKVALALTRLAKEAQPDDRVILYINTHGGRIEALYKGYEVSAEIFAWYTEDRPESAEKATADGRWMTARAFRDLVNRIMAHEIVTVVEACHASAALDDYINNVHAGIGGRGDDWGGRKAVIFSAFDKQIANFSPDGWLPPSPRYCRRNWVNMTTGRCSMLLKRPVSRLFARCAKTAPVITS